MNEKEKAVLDAARELAAVSYCSDTSEEGGVSKSYLTARSRLVDAALDAFSADAEPHPETVRDVADPS